MEINTIPEAFQTKLRLAVLSSLLTGKKNFRELKSTTSATDGNLGAQIKKLNELGYFYGEYTNDDGSKDKVDPSNNDEIWRLFPL